MIFTAIAVLIIISAAVGLWKHKHPWARAIFLVIVALTVFGWWDHAHHPVVVIPPAPSNTVAAPTAPAVSPSSPGQGTTQSAGTIVLLPPVGRARQVQVQRARHGVAAVKPNTPKADAPEPRVRTPEKAAEVKQSGEPVSSLAPVASNVSVALSPSKKRVLVIYATHQWLWTNMLPRVQGIVEEELLKAGVDVVHGYRGQTSPPHDIQLWVDVTEMDSGSAPMSQGSVPQRMAQVTISAVNGGAIYTQGAGSGLFYTQSCTSCVGYAYDGYSRAAAQAVGQIIKKLSLDLKPAPVSDSGTAGPMVD